MSPTFRPMTAQDAYEGLPHMRYGLQRRDEQKRLRRCILSIGVPVGVSLSAQGVIC